MEIQRVGVEIVVAFELHVGAGDTEGKIAEGDHAAIELKTARHAGDHLVDLLILRLSLSTPAEAIDLILDG